MEKLIVILVGFIILYELEARHDAVLSGLKQTTEEGKKWHRLDFYFHFIVAIMIAYLYNGISIEGLLVLLYIGMLRITYFPIRLNRLREPKKPYFYLSKTNGWDKHFEKNRIIYFTVAFLLLFGSATVLIRTQL